MTPQRIPPDKIMRHSHRAAGRFPSSLAVAAVLLLASSCCCPGARASVEVPRRPPPALPARAAAKAAAAERSPTGRTSPDGDQPAGGGVAARDGTCGAANGHDTAVGAAGTSADVPGMEAGGGAVNGGGAGVARRAAAQVGVRVLRASLAPDVLVAVRVCSALSEKFLCGGSSLHTLMLPSLRGSYVDDHGRECVSPRLWHAVCICSPSFCGVFRGILQLLVHLVAIDEPKST